MRGKRCCFLKLPKLLMSKMKMNRIESHPRGGGGGGGGGNFLYFFLD